MNKGHKQIIAEKISSTVRVLELLGFEYEVSGPKNTKEKGNKSPRVVYVHVGESHPIRIYNSVSGYTWANQPDGKPIAEIKNIEDLYNYLYATKRHISMRSKVTTKKRRTRTKSLAKRPLNQFKPENQSEAIKRVWKHFTSLGINPAKFGQSTDSGEITIQTDSETVYITELKLTNTFRVTLRTAGNSKKEQRKKAKVYSTEELAIEAAEKALGL